ncbi:MAG: hypothetical protein M1530_01435 [Candidatus Marsarchaeota archaeon]|nr:hypothetical protein [Candidatus Marsarchaeota archaeon]
MMGSKEEIGQPDWMLGLGMAVLLAGLLAASSISVLNESTYTSALHILRGTPAGPAEILLSGIYHLPGVSSASAGAQGVLDFLLNLPLALVALAAIFAYGALRMLGFDRAESAGAGLLMLLGSPVYEAFLPGFVPDAALAMPLMLLGALGVSLAASAKKEEAAGKGGQGMRGFGGCVLAAIGFSAAVWIMPFSALMPLGLLVGHLLMARGRKEGAAPDAAEIAKMAALLAPFGLLLVGIPALPAMGAAAGNLARLPAQAWMLLGLAAIAIPAGLRAGAHPASRLFLPLILAGLLAALASPALAMVILLLPAAYGLHTLRRIGDEPLGWQGAILFACMVVVLFGLLQESQAGDAVRSLGLAALGAAAAVALAHLWSWNPALVRHGVLMFMFSFALLMTIGFVPGVEANAPYPNYAPLDAGVQQRLLTLGKAGAGAPIATLASADAVQFLSNSQAAGNESQLMGWLASPSGTPAPYPAGTRVLLPVSLFDTIGVKGVSGGRNWTIVAFHYVGTAGTGTNQMAVFDSYAGLRVLHPLDLQAGGLGAARAYLYSLSGNALLKVLRVGEVQLLQPQKSYDTDGNLLLWPNDDLNTELMDLFGSEPGGVKVVSRTPDALLMEVE